MKDKSPTTLVAYMCPSCKDFNTPYFFDRKGYAFMRCKTCKGEYKKLTQACATFRVYSSKHGKKPNRSLTWYSSSEFALKNYLEARGLVEGLDFLHNSRVRDGRLKKQTSFVDSAGKKRKAKWIYYWFDFVVPSRKLVVEVSPEIWHRMGDSKEKDARKKEFVEGLGWKFIELRSEDISRLNRTEGKSSKRPEACKYLDEVLGIRD